VFSFPWATAGLPQRFLALSRTPVLLFRLRQNQLMRRSVLGRSLIAAVWCLGLLSAGNGFAGWQVTQTERLNAPSGLEFVRHTVVSGSKRAELHVVRFDSKRMTLAVMDNPEGALTLGSASLKRGAFAAVNGGYFHPDGTPLGLVVWQGREVHPLERARLLSGLVVVRGGRVSLLRTAEFKSEPMPAAALQAGPFLVDAGQPVKGLDGSRVAARTVVFVDSAGGCGLVACRNATLAETADILSDPLVLGSGQPGEESGKARVVRALNLDGGTSSGLWVAGKPPFYHREIKAVRNYLAVVAAKKDAAR
jgi:hypothetical protein